MCIDMFVDMCTGMCADTIDELGVQPRRGPKVAEVTEVADLAEVSDLVERAVRARC